MEAAGEEGQDSGQGGDLPVLLHFLLFTRKAGSGRRVLWQSAASLLPFVGDDRDDGEEEGGDLRIIAEMEDHRARVDGSVESRHHPLKTVVALVGEEGLRERSRGEHGGNPSTRCDGEETDSLEERMIGKDAGVKGEEVALAANARAQTVEHRVLYDVLAGRYGTSRDEDGRVLLLLLVLDHTVFLLHRGIVALDNS